MEFKSIVATGGLSVSASATELTISGTSSGTGITWTDVTGTTQAMAVNNGYVANNAGLVTLTLPSTSAFGSIFEVVGKGAGGWKLAQNASQTVHFGNVDTTTGTGGYLSSNQRYDAIRIICTAANTDFNIVSAQGNITIV